MNKLSPTSVDAFVQAALRTWSPYQEAAFAFVTSGTGNLVLRAGAGSGKTTTGVEMTKRVTGSHIYLAFNKSIQVELEKRGVNARTFHSLAWSAVTRARNVRNANANKLRDIVDNWDGFDRPLYGSFVVKLVSLAKNAGIGCLVDDIEQAWDDLAAKHDVELEHEDADYATAIELARKLLQLSNTHHECDFDDMLYFAVKNGIVLPKFDNVFVDEAQDTNAIQRAIIRKIMKDSSRLFAIGDPSQAIYGFRGADSDSIDLIAEEFSATRLPLTVSYRCGSEIVKYASKFGEIEAAPEAHTGSVHQLPTWKPEDFEAGNLVVSRCTAPLIVLAYQLLKARIPAYVMGREIGQGLVNLIKKMNAEGIDNLITRLDEYTAREMEKAIAKKQEAKAEAIQDKTDCLLFLIDSLVETGRTVPALLTLIDDLFSNKSNAVILATIHKAKGLEADTVFWLNYDYVSKWARQPWQKQQEVNLQYVAATRAKNELFLIREKAKW